MIIAEIMVVQKQDMQKHVRIPETTCTRGQNLYGDCTKELFLQFNVWCLIVIYMVAMVDILVP